MVLDARARAIFDDPELHLNRTGKLQAAFKAVEGARRDPRVELLGRRVRKSAGCQAEIGFLALRYINIDTKLCIAGCHPRIVTTDDEVPVVGGFEAGGVDQGKAFVGQRSWVGVYLQRSWQEGIEIILRQPLTEVPQENGIVAAAPRMAKPGSWGEEMAPIAPGGQHVMDPLPRVKVFQVPQLHPLNLGRLSAVGIRGFPLRIDQGQSLAGPLGGLAVMACQQVMAG